MEEGPSFQAARKNTDSSFLDRSFLYSNDSAQTIAVSNDSLVLNNDPLLNDSTQQRTTTQQVLLGIERRCAPAASHAALLAPGVMNSRSVMNAKLAQRRELAGVA